MLAERFDRSPRLTHKVHLYLLVSNPDSKQATPVVKYMETSSVFLESGLRLAPSTMAPNTVVVTTMIRKVSWEMSSTQSSDRV